MKTMVAKLVAIALYATAVSLGSWKCEDILRSVSEWVPRWNGALWWQKAKTQRLTGYWLTVIAVGACLLRVLRLIDSPELVALVGIIAVIAFWILNFPWDLIDEAVGAAISRLMSGFKSRRWDKTRSERFWVYRLSLIGFLLVLFFPFGLVWRLWPKMSFWGIGSSTEALDLWEFAVCAWTGVFLILFFLKETRAHTTALGIQSASAATFGYIGAGIVTIITSGVVWLILGKKEPILGEEFIALTFFLVDVALLAIYKLRGVRRAKRAGQRSMARNLGAGANSFLRFIVILDGPTLLAFGVILIFWKSRSFADEKMAQHFASGATALGLVLVNTIFSVLYIVEAYNRSVFAESGNPALAPHPLGPPVAKPTVGNPPISASAAGGH